MAKPEFTLGIVFILLIYDTIHASPSCPAPQPCHCDLSIHCELQSLTAVPSSLFSSPPSSSDHIFYSLNVKENNIHDVSRGAFKHYPVHGIDLSHNPISHMDDDAFLGLSGLLLELNLEHCGLTSIPSSVANLTSLKKLNIRHNPIAVLKPSITAGVGNSLISLSFGSTKITYWPVALNSLKRLESLDMSNNKVSFLRNGAASAFANTLQDLRLVNCSLATFQVAFRDLKALQNLDLSHNPIQEIPQGSFLNVATTLKHLTITHGELSYLPAALGDLTSLMDLDLSNNPMISSKEDVLAAGPSPLLAKMASTLVSLHLASTSLIAVPVSLKNMSVLKLLDLSSNAIQRLENYQFDSLKSLSQLNLNNNPIYSVPYQSFSGLTLLTSLTMANCSMTYVPSGAISQLKALLTLDLSNNRIHFILDHAFPNSKRLTTVDLSGNSLANVSKRALDDATVIRTLKLNRCHLNFLPHALQYAQGLRTVELFDNFIPCTCDTMGWLRAWQAATGIIPRLLGQCDNDYATAFDSYVLSGLLLCPSASDNVG